MAKPKSPKTAPAAPAPDLSYIAPALRQFAVATESLKFDPRNARLHSDRNIQGIQKSLLEFGQQRPVIVHLDGRTVIAGNATLQATILLGRSHIAAMPSELAGAMATAYGLADNRTPESAEWDLEQLGILLKELEAGQFAVENLGWQDFELDPLMAAEWTPDPIAEMPDRPAPAGAETGQEASNPANGPDEPSTPETPFDDPPKQDLTDKRPDAPRFLAVTVEQLATIQLAIDRVRAEQEEPEMPESQALVKIAEAFLAS